MLWFDSLLLPHVWWPIITILKRVLQVSDVALLHACHWQTWLYFRGMIVFSVRVQFGDSQQLRLVRILRSTVMVRVGGGWMALDEFLVKNDPCRGNVHFSLLCADRSIKLIDIVHNRIVQLIYTLYFTSSKTICYVPKPSWAAYIGSILTHHRLVSLFALPSKIPCNSKSGIEWTSWRRQSHIALTQVHSALKRIKQNRSVSFKNGPLGHLWGSISVKMLL